ncbi:MAG TPA: hypothetical protein PK530_09025 [Anaerolineales bacterium]|nr:hypothetical protein [Anaerolineales bacterium]
MSKIALIVRTYRASNALTLEKMASALRENLVGTQFENLSRQAIGLWEKGTQPMPIFLLRVSRSYTDWRRNFALDCLAAIEPETFTPVGDIGREILSESGVNCTTPLKTPNLHNKPLFHEEYGYGQ